MFPACNKVRGGILCRKKEVVGNFEGVFLGLVHGMNRLWIKGCGLVEDVDFTGFFGCPKFLYEMVFNKGGGASPPLTTLPRSLAKRKNVGR